MIKRIERNWAIIFIAVIWLMFSSPFFLKGMIPFPSKYQVNFFAPWSSYQQFWGPVKNNAMPDIITQIYPWRYLSIKIWESGQIPLWNPLSFSGTPHLANYQSAVLSPFNLIFLISDLFPRASGFSDAWSLLVLLQPLLAGIFTYLFARSLRITKFGSLISSISFMFCGFITTWMGYATLGYAIVFLPLALYSVDKFIVSKRILFLIIFSLSIPLSFFSGHFQISLYFILAVFLYLIFKLLSEKNKIPVLYCFAFTIFGLFLSMPQIFPSIEFYFQSARSSMFLGLEIIPWKYLPTLIAPDFFGNPVTRNDWFGHYAEWNSYVGVIPLFLALFAIIKREKSEVYFFLIISLLSLSLAFETPILHLLINFHIPVISTSAASRIIVLFSFSIAMLAGLGLDSLMKNWSKNLKVVLFWIGISSAIFCFLWLSIFLHLFADSSKINIARNNMVLPTLIFLTLYVITLLNLFLRRKKLISFSALLLLIIVSFDMLRFATKWQAFDPKNLVFPEVSITKFYPQISSIYRVMGNYSADNSIYYSLPSVEGYDPVYIGRYGEFINSLSDGKIKENYRSVVMFPKNGINTPLAINLLGIKYFVHKRSDDKQVWSFPFFKYPVDQFRVIYNDDKFQVFENQKVFPRAFMVGKYSVEKNDQKIIDTLFGKNFDLKSEVVLEKDPKVLIDNFQADSRILSYSSNRIIIKTTGNSGGILLLTDNYYPGWRAEIDGKKTSILRADYTFRAVVVPKGDHTIEFMYDPVSFRAGIYLALFGILGIILGSYILNRKS